MIDQQMINYMMQLLYQRYSSEQIRAFLQSRNYPLNYINENLKAAEKEFKAVQKQQLLQIEKANKQFISQLKDYVRGMLNQGYSLENIQSSLLSQGYDYNHVNSVINSLRESHIHIPKSWASVSAALLIILGIFGVLFFTGIISIGSFSTRAAERAMDLKIEDLNLDSEILPKDTYRFKVTGINTGKAKGYDVSYTYYLEDFSGKRYRQKTESKILDYTFSEIFDYEIPADIPDGNYKLWTIVNYGTGKAEASIEIYVGKTANKSDTGTQTQETNQQQSQNQGTQSSSQPPEQGTNSPNTQNTPDSQNTQNPQTSQTSEQYSQEVAQEIKNELTYVKWKSELTPATIANVEAQARKDPNYAVFLCKNFNMAEGRESCLKLIAVTTKDMNYCEQIEIPLKKDLCYLDFAMNSDDLAICGKITDATAKKTCAMLVQSNYYRTMYGIKSTSGIIDYLSGTQSNETQRS